MDSLEARIVSHQNRASLLLLLQCLLLLGACAAPGRIGPDSLRSGPSPFETDAPLSEKAPHGTLMIRSVTDRRPGFELGTLDYLGASFESDGLFDVPIDTVLGDAVMDSIVRAGLFQSAAELASAQYLLDIEILHLYSCLERNLLSLIPVVPNIKVNARMTLRLRLTDQDGRPFLTQQIDHRATQRAAGLTATKSLSRNLLRGLLREIMAEWTPSADRAISLFWKQLAPTPLKR